MEVLKRILQCFELYSDLKINLSRSMLVGMGCHVKICSVFGFQASL